jgi:antitoxin component of MazEF toxin-antitoxin module
MRTQIKQWGDSAVMVITQENLKLYKLKIGDIVDLEITEVKK